MGANNKHYNDQQRTFNNTSPSNKKQYSSSQRPSPSKSINIKTPNKNFNVAGKNNNYYNNNYNNCNTNNNATRLSLSGSPTTSFFAASKCFESPSPDSLPKPPSTWTTNSTTKSTTTNRVRKALIMPNDTIINNSCAMEYAAASSIIDKNDHFTQNLKLLLNVNA